MTMAVVVVAIALCIALTSAIPNYSDLPPGPYCASRPSGCCLGRQDNCSFPILTTRCYCDDFCDRLNREDCCPDFYSHCKGVIPPPDDFFSCYYKGRYIPPDSTLQENCNLCKCEKVQKDGKTIREMLCERDECMIEPNMVSSVNRDERILGWRAGNHSEFWGHKLDEGLTLRLGTLQPHRSVLKMEPVRRIYDPHALPNFFDSEAKWPEQLTKIQDQGWCGASWAISTAAVASDRYAIMSRGEESVKLSSQHLLSCNNRGQQSCHGGYLDRAWLYLRKFGVVDEECYPYQGKSEKCKVPKRSKLLREHCGNPPKNPKRKFMYRTAPAYRLGNETDIMYEILKNGPVQATMKVHQDFFTYKRGVYRHSEFSSGHRTAYHSVRIIGWGEDRNIFPPRKYWKVANSWGRQWGEEGYFRIARGTNECDIESYVLGSWAQPVDNSLNEVAESVYLRG